MSEDWVNQIAVCQQPRQNDAIVLQVVKSLNKRFFVILASYCFQNRIENCGKTTHKSVADVVLVEESAKFGGRHFTDYLSQLAE